MFIPAESTFENKNLLVCCEVPAECAPKQLDVWFDWAGEGLKKAIVNDMMTIVKESYLVGEEIRDGEHHTPRHLTQLAGRHWDVCLNWNALGWKCFEKVFILGGMMDKL